MEQNYRFDAGFNAIINGHLMEVGASLLGLDGDFVLLPEKLLKITERNLDSLSLFQPKDGSRESIIHIEVQTANHPDMISRMLTYFALVNEQYGQPPVQFIIYIGKDRLTMADSLIVEGVLSFKVKTIDLREVDAEVLLSWHHPDMAVLAILCSYPDKKELVQRIIRIIQESGLDETAMEHYLSTVRMMGTLRNLETLIVNVYMENEIVINLMEDALYVKGHGDGGNEKELEILYLQASHHLKAGKSLFEVAKMLLATEEKIQAALEYGRNKANGHSD